MPIQNLPEIKQGQYNWVVRNGGTGTIMRARKSHSFPIMRSQQFPGGARLSSRIMNNKSYGSNLETLEVNFNIKLGAVLNLFTISIVQGE